MLNRIIVIVVISCTINCQASQGLLNNRTRCSLLLSDQFLPTTNPSRISRLKAVPTDQQVQFALKQARTEAEEGHKAYHDSIWAQCANSPRSQPSSTLSYGVFEERARRAWGVWPKTKKIANMIGR